MIKSRDAVAKAILTANLNLNPEPLSDKSTIRVPVPKMSAEYRETIQKQIASMAEQSKQRIRNQHQDFRTAAKKCGLTKDDLRRVENEVRLDLMQCIILSHIHLLL